MTHWKALTNPDYLGSYAFDRGEEKTGTIREIKREIVTGPEGKKEECTVCHFSEPDLKPLILNVTNCKAISKLYGTPYTEEWAGKRIIMRVQQVKAFGETVDAVRIKPQIPPALPTCAECGKMITAYGNMNPAQVAAYTSQKYGKCLCTECAKQAKAESE